ncbi:hypothetical protein [Paraburkholderia sp. BCC1885]|nr:hypothetical protein [Paraburkholderia sp. BCC1885]
MKPSIWPAAVAAAVCVATLTQPAHAADTGSVQLIACVGLWTPF